MGGGGRLDVRVNLVALCRACHGLVHAGHVQRLDLLAVVSAREGVLQSDIEAAIWALRRAPKYSIPAVVLAMLKVRVS